jgi:hypothetical protein
VPAIPENIIERKQEEDNHKQHVKNMKLVRTVKNKRFLG